MTRTMHKLLMCAALLLIALQQPGHTQQFKPSGPINVVVGFAPGGGADLSARLVTDKMSEYLKTPVNVVNKPGAGSGLAMQLVKNSPADGQTVALVSSTAVAINHVFNADPGYDTLKDFDSVGMIFATPFAMITNPTLPGKTVPDAVKSIRNTPGKFTAGGTVNGKEHIMTMLFLKHAQAEMPYAGYKGGALAQNDLLAGHIHLRFDILGSVQQHIQTGQVNLLAVSWPTRLKDYPNVPTWTELGYPEELNNGHWYGLMVRKGTPQHIIKDLNDALRHALNDPGVKNKMSEMAGHVVNYTPAQMQDMISKEYHSMQKIGKEFNLLAK